MTAEQEELLPAKPQGVSENLWQIFIAIPTSQIKALTIRNLAPEVFPYELRHIAHSRINTVIASGRLCRLCLELGSHLHIIKSEAYKEARSFWRDPIFSSEETSQKDEISKEKAGESDLTDVDIGTHKMYLPPPVLTTPRTPIEIAELFSKYPINIGDPFRGIHPNALTPEVFEKRYSRERRIRHY